MLHVRRDKHRKPKLSLNVACSDEWLITHTGHLPEQEAKLFMYYGPLKETKNPSWWCLKPPCLCHVGFFTEMLLQANRISKFYQLCKRQFLLFKETSYCANDRFNTACNVPGRPMYFPKTAGNGNCENKEISKAGLNPQGLFRAAWKAIFICWSKRRSIKNLIFFRERFHCLTYGRSRDSVCLLQRYSLQ